MQCTCIGVVVVWVLVRQSNMACLRTVKFSIIASHDVITRIDKETYQRASSGFFE